MKVMTSFAGEIEYQEEDVFRFPDGIYGFPDTKKFIVIGEMTAEFPFIWLQCLEKKEIVFVVTNPFLFKEGYDFDLKEDELKKLEINNKEQVMVTTLVVIPDEKLEESTTNLKAPVIFNMEKRIGRQVILDEDFSSKFKKKEKNGDPEC